MKHNPTMNLGTVLFRALLFITVAVPAMAQTPEEFYPPLFNGKVDFAGDRFGVYDVKGQFKGIRPGMMKAGFIVRYESPPGHHSLPPDIILYLARDTTGEDILEEEDDKDTMIRYVRTLNDLRGFVKIRTETDALEFLRFGSCSTNSNEFTTDFQEIFCIADTSVLPSREDNGALFWATREQCLRLNFSLPRILNPLPPKEGEEIKADKDGDDDDSPKKRKRQKAKRFFLIERTVQRGPHSTLKDGLIFRIVEEVGPEGQWRLVSYQAIPIARRDWAEILRQSLFLH